jgi:hypothetical protein
MKLHRIVFACTLIMLPQLLNAKLPFSNDAFGKVEGILAYCAKVNPESAVKYQDAAKALVKDASEKEVTEARNSVEYKESIDSINAQLEKAPKENSIKACRDYLNSK